MMEMILRMFDVERCPLDAHNVLEENSDQELYRL